MTFKKAAVSLLFIAIIIVAFFFFETYVFPTLSPSTSSNPAYTPTRTANAVLREGNPAFAEADQLVRQKAYAQAQAKYLEALPQAQDAAQEAQIKLKYAIAQNLKGDPTGAVPLFKEVVANTTYPQLTRAYAAQYIGQIFVLTSSAEARAAIFSTAPYASLNVPSDINLSSRHLFEYASSIYPLAISELRIASWYANQLVATLPASSVNATSTALTGQALTNKGIVEQKLKNADADIVRTKVDPDAAQLIPAALELKANVLSKYAVLGMIDPVAADQAFQQAIGTANAAHSNIIGSVRLNYAIFLFRVYGKTRSADITAALAPTYTGAPDPAFAKYLASVKTDSLFAKQKHYVAALANIDATFKSSLTSSGWTDADFK